MQRPRRGAFQFILGRFFFGSGVESTWQRMRKHAKGAVQCAGVSWIFVRVGGAWRLFRKLRGWCWERPGVCDCLSVCVALQRQEHEQGRRQPCASAAQEQGRLEQHECSQEQQRTKTRQRRSHHAGRSLAKTSGNSRDNNNSKRNTTNRATHQQQQRRGKYN